MTTSAFLVARDLEYYALNGDVLLQQASFELDVGAILAIAGLNGAGKTTLLKLLCGAAELVLGDVLVRGRSLKRMSAAERVRMIAVVGQQELPDGRHSLREYVTLGQIPIRADRSREDHAQDLCRILDLTGRASKGASSWRKGPAAGPASCKNGPETAVLLTF